ncbi:MAG: GxxExxY protein [Vicinamibacterales bacterium]
MEQSASALNKLTEQIIGAAIHVHRTLGPGLLESAYEICLYQELLTRGLKVERQKPLPLVYSAIALDCVYRVDIVVEAAVVVEVKSVTRFDRVHEAQMVSYLKLSKKCVGLLINFNVRVLAETGIKRLVNGFPG